jgi:glycolate oxidase
LAAFGDITLRLIPKPEGLLTLLALFPGMREASATVEAIVAARLTPRCLEFLDQKTLTVMRDSGVALRADAGALLIIEVDGSETECERQAELIGNVAASAGALGVDVASSADARARLWASRKQMSHAVRSRARHKLSEDVVVPRRQLSALLAEVEAIGQRQQIDALAYGHAGDGNLHVNFLWNDDSEYPRVAEAIRQLFVRTVALGGTLSGEHGIGLLKAEHLPLEQSHELIELQKELKRVFDPRGILNPGKIFPARGHGAC